MEMDKEEGEMSDDAMQIDDYKDVEKSNDTNSAVVFKVEKDGIMVSQLEKIDAAKLEERANRFGINLEGSRAVTQTQINELYSHFEITGNERHFRFDTLHLHGIDGLTTREIFEYLEDFKPISLEQIDETSCNIVCQDHISVALALLVHSREIKDENLRNMLANKSCHHWREGLPHPKKDLILMRFATNGDKKLPKKKSEAKPSDYYDEAFDSESKNPWGDLCKSWGVYDHQEVFQRQLPKTVYEDEIEYGESVRPIRNKKLAMRLGKRKPEENSDSDSDSEWNKKSKQPRMRMHADDEESKQKRTQFADIVPKVEKEVYAPLCIEVVNSQNVYVPKGTTILSQKFKSHTKSNTKVAKESVQSRLGSKVQASVIEEAWSGDEFSDDSASARITMSKVHKVKRPQAVSSIPKSTSSVWSRLQTKSVNNTVHDHDLRQILKSKKHSKSDDLRQRIKKSKQCNLRIEIDNKY